MAQFTPYASKLDNRVITYCSGEDPCYKNQFTYLVQKRTSIPLITWLTGVSLWFTESEHDQEQEAYRKANLPLPR